MRKIISLLSISCFLLFACSETAKSPETKTSTPTTAPQISSVATNDVKEQVQEQTTTQPQSAPIIEKQITYFCDNGMVQIETIGTQTQVTVTPSDQTLFTFMAQKTNTGRNEDYVGEEFTLRTQGNSCLVEKGGELIINACYELKSYEGLFTYFADSNMFFPCDGSDKMPVERSGEYLALEKKYLSLVDGPTKVFLQAKGYVKSGPKRKGKEVKRTLIIKDLVAVEKGKDCG